ncbi:MAG: DUF4845 domain-containing protein [Chromatiales bacterium]|nr:DUF4845 domain-containing protein [Chromatiales bacterium]
MYKNQRGMTTIGMILAAAIAGLIVFAGLRLAPVYLEYMKVAGVLDSVHADLNGTNPTVRDIKRGIQSRLDIERIEIVDANDYKIAKEGKGYRVSVKYEHKAPYIYNVSFLVDFEKSIEITR